MVCFEIWPIIGTAAMLVEIGISLRFTKDRYLQPTVPGVKNKTKPNLKNQKKKKRNPPKQTTNKRDLSI